MSYNRRPQLAQYDPDQAFARCIELHKKRDQEIDQRPDLERRMARGDYDFSVDADYELWDLEQVAQRNGYLLEWTFDRTKWTLSTLSRK